MYSSKPKQNWKKGNVVKVGFLTLTVQEYTNTGFILVNTKGVKYEFEPYKGLFKLGV